MNYPFDYPVLGFAPSPHWARHGYKGEWIQAFSDDAGISQCRAGYVAQSDLAGMQLVDSSGQAWEVTGVRFEGPLGSKWRQFQRALFSYQIYRVDLDIAERPAVSLDDVKARICRAIDADPQCYIDVELVAGEAGPPQDPDKLVEDLKARVLAASSNRELIEVVSIIDELI